MRPLAFLALAACGGGGGGPDAPVRCSGFFGVADAGVELQVVYLDADDHLQVAADGARVPLRLPPQGGRVIFAGVRARNLDTCAIDVVAAIRDLPTVGPDGGLGAVVGLEGRPINLMVPDGGVWAEPTDPTQISSYANIAVCPNQRSTRNLYDVPYELSVSLTDHAGRQAATTITVTPYCGEPTNVADCLCKCREGYMLGDLCTGPDAGP